MIAPKDAADVWKRICEIYDQTREETPRETAEAVVRELGQEKAMEVFAIVTKLKAHDGRIYGKNRELMERIGTDPAAIKWERENPMVSSLLDHIHPAHINQIIGELVKTA